MKKITVFFVLMSFLSCSNDDAVVETSNELVQNEKMLVFKDEKAFFY